MSDLFLGLDCSTQSLTAVLIDFKDSQVIYKNSINFDKDLPQYNTQNGVIIIDDERVVHSYPLMWIDALELLFKKLNDESVRIEDIKAISGSGQQHGTVYLNSQFEGTLQNLVKNKTFSEQIAKTLSRETTTISTAGHRPSELPNTPLRAGSCNDS